MVQAIIALTGVVAIWLSQSSDARHQRIAPFFGLAGQPFWIYVAVTSEQWGITLVTLLYTVAWLRGCIRVYTESMSDVLGNPGSEVGSNK